MSQGFEMYSVRNMVSNYVLCLYGKVSYQIHGGDQFQMYRGKSGSITGTNIVLQINYTSETNSEEAELRFVVTRDGG